MKERNYGIDLLRIVSMIGVMTLHILGHGGVLDNTKILSFNYDLAWLLEVCAYCAVDCFVLISGYVSVQARHKGSNIVLLWLKTDEYSGWFYISCPVIWKSLFRSVFVHTES